MFILQNLISDDEKNIKNNLTNNKINNKRRYKVELQIAGSSSDATAIQIDNYITIPSNEHQYIAYLRDNYYLRRGSKNSEIFDFGKNPANLPAYILEQGLLVEGYRSLLYKSYKIRGQSHEPVITNDTSGMNLMELLYNEALIKLVNGLAIATYFLTHRKRIAYEGDGTSAVTPEDQQAYKVAGKVAYNRLKDINPQMLTYILADLERMKPTSQDLNYIIRSIALRAMRKKRIKWIDNASEGYQVQNLQGSSVVSRDRLSGNSQLDITSEAGIVQEILSHEAVDGIQLGGASLAEQREAIDEGFRAGIGENQQAIQAAQEQLREITQQYNLLNGRLGLAEQTLAQMESLSVDDIQQLITTAEGRINQEIGNSEERIMQATQANLVQVSSESQQALANSLQLGNLVANLNAYVYNTVTQGLIPHIMALQNAITQHSGNLFAMQQSITDIQRQVTANREEFNQRITAETGRATAAESQLRTDLDQEALTRQKTASKLGTKIATVQGDLTSNIDQLNTDIQGLSASNQRTFSKFGSRIATLHRRSLELDTKIDTVNQQLQDSIGEEREKREREIQAVIQQQDENRTELYGQYLDLQRTLMQEIGKVDVENKQQLQRIDFTIYQAFSLVNQYNYESNLRDQYLLQELGKEIIRATAAEGQMRTDLDQEAQTRQKSASKLGTKIATVQRDLVANIDQINTEIERLSASNQRTFSRFGSRIATLHRRSVDLDNKIDTVNQQLQASIGQERETREREIQAVIQQQDENRTELYGLYLDLQRELMEEIGRVETQGKQELRRIDNTINQGFQLLDTYNQESILRDQFLFQLIENETLRATGAEGQLRTDLGVEKDRATGAEGQLRTDLGVEKDRATGAEGVLQTGLDDETRRATGAEGVLQTGLDDETRRATGAEGVLQTGLDDETRRATGAEGVLQTGLDDETRRATGAEGVLQTGLDDETRRATGAEGVLQTGLDDETRRATGAEGVLQTKVTKRYQQQETEKAIRKRKLLNVNNRITNLQKISKRRNISHNINLDTQVRRLDNKLKDNVEELTSSIEDLQVEMNSNASDQKQINQKMAVAMSKLAETNIRNVAQINKMKKLMPFGI
ncbi:hypothetical protein CPAV1605_686 [seawater metagenome]|uniref:Uncharacterized protein n=1 Tax=seawater metagenome TaxID=1561972 RepID=A0A5E8CIC9_9ZZZZ